MAAIGPSAIGRSRVLLAVCVLLALLVLPAAVAAPAPPGGGFPPPPPGPGFPPPPPGPGGATPPAPSNCAVKQRRICPWFCDRDDNNGDGPCLLKKACPQGQICIPFVRSCKGYKCVKIFPGSK
ncbi:hypothetical protein CLOP_g18324 [Closterium sp. NIES-67]|nr:hypothetical protein CLOP_g18324 [Closterium sp. NIES-67]